MENKERGMERMRRKGSRMRIRGKKWRKSRRKKTWKAGEDGKGKQIGSVRRYLP